MPSPGPSVALGAPPRSRGWSHFSLGSTPEHPPSLARSIRWHTQDYYLAMYESSQPWPEKIWLPPGDHATLENLSLLSKSTQYRIEATQAGGKRKTRTSLLLQRWGLGENGCWVWKIKLQRWQTRSSSTWAQISRYFPWLSPWDIEVFSMARGIFYGET